jgi:hypothetical protein
MCEIYIAFQLLLLGLQSTLLTHAVTSGQPRGLHAQLWELLRFRNGQAPGPGAALIDDARLLGG